MSEIYFSPNIFNTFTIRSNEQKKKAWTISESGYPHAFSSLLQDLPSRNPESIGPASR
jgi:hypothetical protein